MARRLLWKILFGVFLLYTLVATYVANWVVPPLVNTWDDGHIQYRFAISFLPSIVHVSGFEIRHKDRVVQWSATLGWVTTGINLFSLTQRKFRPYFVWGRNVVFRMAMNKSAADPAISTLMPPFPGIPEKKKSEDDGSGESRPWVISLPRVSLSALREIWFERYHFEGIANVQGGFEIIPKTEVWVGPARLELETGRAFAEGKTLVEPLQATLNVTLSPFNPDAQDLDDLKFLNIDGNIRTEVATLDFLNTYFQEAKWLRAVSGGGPLDLAVRIEKGRFLPPGALKIHSKKTVLDILENRLEGDAKILGRVDHSRDGRLEAEMQLEIDGFEVSDPKTDERHLEGDGFKIKVRTDQLTLATLFSNLAIDLELKDARIPKLSYYNRYIPKQTGLKITEGQGIVNASVQSFKSLSSDKGTFEVTAKNAKVSYEKLVLSGEVSLKATLRQGSVAKKRFDISGTQIKIENIMAREGGVTKVGKETGWWGTLWTPKAKFQLATPLQASGLVRCKLKDVKPLLAVYSVRNQIPEMLSPVLDMEGLDASTQFEINRDLVEFQKVEILGENLRLRGRIRLLPWESRSTWLADYKMLSVGLERVNDESRTVLHEADKWFQKQVNYIPLKPNELGTGPVLE